MLNRSNLNAIRRLKESGLRPTRQRVSLATIYNTLHQFTAAELMTEVVAGSGLSYFDTNPTSHYHYFDKTNGEIIDVPENAIQFTVLPDPPPGKVIDRIDVAVRIRSAGHRS